MHFNHHDDPRSQAEEAQWLGKTNWGAVIQEATFVLLTRGHPLSEHDPTLTYPFGEMAKMVAFRTKLNRKQTVIPRLEEACCEDDSAPFMTQDNPNGRGALILFNPDHPQYAPDGTPRTPPTPRRRKGLALSLRTCLTPTATGSATSTARSSRPPPSCKTPATWCSAPSAPAWCWSPSSKSFTHGAAWTGGR